MSETAQLERYLQNKIDPEEKFLMDARCIIDADLRNKLFWQQKTYILISHYGREKLRAEIKATEEHIFSNDKFIKFRTRIKKIFKP